jgi:hypothetical protein
MTILLDNKGYITLRPILEREARRRKIPLEVKNLNDKGWGDLVIMGLDGIYSVEIKQAGEYIGDVDHLITQLKAQVPNADFTYVFIYGEQEQAADGYSLSLAWERDQTTWEKGTDSGVARHYKRHYHRVNHLAQRKILWRIRQEGIQVVECRTLYELAYELCNFYEVATTVGTTFTRLTPEKFFIKEEDRPRRNFMLTLMGIQGAGVGEELADAITAGLEYEDCPLTIAGLLQFTNEEPDRWEQAVAMWKLRSGKRTIGPAAVQKLKTALGL